MADSVANGMPVGKALPRGEDSTVHDASSGTTPCFTEQEQVGVLVAAEFAYRGFRLFYSVRRSLLRSPTPPHASPAALDVRPRFAFDHLVDTGHTLPL